MSKFPLFAGAVAGFVLTLLALWPVTLNLFSLWVEIEAWHYAALVLPAFVYLVGWEYRRELLADTPAPGWLGFCLAIVALITLVIADLLAVNLGKHISVVLFLQAVLLAALGWRVYLNYLPLWALLFLMVPYEDVVLPVLRAATLASVEAFTAFTGLEFSAQGYGFEVRENRYAIVPACAGLSFFTLAIFLGYSFGLVVFRRWLPILGFTAGCGLVAVLANFFRVNAIILFDVLNGTQADLAGHSSWWWVSLAAMVALISLMVVRLSVAPARHPAEAVEPALPIRRWWLPVATASISLLGLLFLIAGEQTESSRHSSFPTVTAPVTLGNWRLGSGSGHWGVRLDKGSAYTAFDYLSGATSRRVIVDRSHSLAFKLFPGRIPPDEESQWSLQRSDTGKDCNATLCVSYLHHVWQRDGSDDIYNVYNSYLLDGNLTTSKASVRVARGLARLRGEGDPAAIVSLVSDDPITRTGELLEQLVSLKAAFAPQLAGNSRS